MTFTSRLSVVFVVTLAACSSTVSAPDNDAAVDTSSDVTVDALPDAPVDAPLDYCILPNGSRCPRGTSCPAGDGCNTCSCYGPGLTAGCTLIACSPPDAGTRRCTSRTDCRGGEFCNFPSSGCATYGTCQLATPCAESVALCGCDGTTYFACAADRPTRNEGFCGVLDAGPPVCRTSADCTDGRECQFSSPACGGSGVCGYPRDCAFIVEYCGCDGQTFRDCPGGTTSTPYRSVGACGGGEDGGVAPACAAAHIGRDGRSCVGAADEPLDLNCCTWNCDTRTAACEPRPPRCPAGQVNTVAGACWGPCVAPTSCAPMRCASDSGCIAPWRCDATRGLCVYGG